jgi:GT2 family glycosyltransferase
VRPPSLVVPLPSDPAAALRCLEALAAQPEEPAHAIVLVDDDAPALAPLLQRVGGDVDVVRLPRRSGAAAALRAGAARASGDVLVLLRTGATPAPGFLAALLTTLESGARVATGEDAVAVRREDAEIALAAAALTDPASAPEIPRARGELGREIELTIVVPTLDAASERVRSCLRAIAAATDVAHDIVLVDNGAPPQGFSAPVNAGLRAARGRYAVVLNDDVEVLPGWWPPLREALDAGASVAFPRTLDGFDRDDFAAWCFAVSRDTLERHAATRGEFLDPEMQVWFQDTDLLERLRAAGRPPVRVEGAAIRHATSTTLGSEDPELQAWIAMQTQRDRAAFERRHPHARLVEKRVA